MNKLAVLIAVLLLSLLAITPGAQAQRFAQYFEDDGPPITLDASWDGSSRFTMLVLGLDRRPGARNNLNARADVLLLLSFSPFERRVGVLSIPRDMHFPDLVTGELLRVNTLLVEGEAIREGYGPYYAMETLQNNLGMFIDAYLIFDFEAFITLIDAIGGVDVDVPYAINDPTYPDMNYGYSPFFVSPGLQTMNGARALKYARTRHGDNDYRRGERQLQILRGVYERLSAPARLQQLVIQAPTLLRELSGHLYSNLPANDMIYLGLSMSDLRPEEITMGAMGADYSFDYQAPGLGRVRVPDRNQLVRLMIDVFGANYVSR
jgi:polyisoprenyl-teichoic acid--peptidoglycan teichoic acid transferase